LYKAFRTYDIDGDGHIKAHELKEIMEEHQME
jgi:Ca2+-binding EF-hand superfamily protein